MDSVESASLTVIYAGVKIQICADCAEVLAHTCLCMARPKMTLQYNLFIHLVSYL